MMIKYLALTAALAATPVHAGQPIYQSMAECAGLMDALVQQIRSPGPRRDRLVGATQNWADAAQSEAGHDVSDLIAAKSEFWREKGPTVVFTEDFKDWAAYCRSLAKHKGLKIDPGA